MTANAVSAGAINLKNAVAAHLRRCMTLEMALPFHRIMRLAAGLHLRFCSTHWVREQIDENGIFLQAISRNSVTAAFLRINLENAVKLVNPPDRLLLSIFSCLSWPPIWCPENADVVQLQGVRCAGMAHAISSFVQRRTPQAGRCCVFQDHSSINSACSAPAPWIA